MKVGDLVTVGPSYGGTYIITSLTAYEHHGRTAHSPQLEDCVLLAKLSGPHAIYGNEALPMNKKWIKVLSES